MSEAVYVRGGFGTDTDHLSPGLAARIATADAEFERQAEAQRREAEVLREQRREADLVASIQAAQDRGEWVDVRRAIRDGGVGRTRAEAVAHYSALGDLQEQREAAIEAARIREFLAEDTPDHEPVKPDLRPFYSDGPVVGHTPAEFIALATARADAEDLAEAARERDRVRKFLAGELGSGHTTAPTRGDSAEVTLTRTEREGLLGQARYQAQSDLDARLRRMRVSP